MMFFLTSFELARLFTETPPTSPMEDETDPKVRMKYIMWKE
ncbi:unnamed protein product [Rhodiola kirilowii]